MVPSGKWIEGINPDGSVEDAARRSLDARLTSVVHWLPLAAYLAEQDVEHVHRLRVATRRAIAALRLYRDSLPAKEYGWLKKRLKKIRRAAGEARDLDVLADRLERDYGERAAPVLKLIAERRLAAQPAIVEMAERCRRYDKFVRKIGQLIAKITRPANATDAPANFRDWAAKRLADATTTFLASVPDESADVGELHQFRIRGKAVRYTIELVSAACEPELLREQYPLVEELQERLGKVQDHVTAAARLQEWAHDHRYREDEILLATLAEEELQKLVESRREFHEWWAAEGPKFLGGQLQRA